MSRAAGSSYTDGAEDFVYLLNECLLNYGSLIVAELFKSALPLQSLRQSPPFEPPKYADAVTSANPGEDSYAHKVDSHPATTNVAPIVAARTPTVHDGRKEHDKSNEHDGNNAELRQHIRSLRSNVTDDPSILPWSEVAGLSSAKIYLEEFAASFFHFPHLTAKLRHQSSTGVLVFGPQGTGKTLLIKSFAQKHGFAFFDIRASAIMSKFAGDSEKFIKALFDEVQASAPAILFLDECDGLLCNPAADSSMSQSYRLLQNELKNQWSDLIYSKAKAIVVGATNKPHDIDMDGFGRRLSLKLYIDLPNAQACRQILSSTLECVRHTVEDIEMVLLGDQCADKGLSGYDVDCVIEGLVRKGLRQIILSKHFRKMLWESRKSMVSCGESDEGAIEGGWESVGDKSSLTYYPLSYEDVHHAIQQARPTVDAGMLARHEHFASQHCPTESA